MSKPKLDEDIIRNELSESAFFRKSPHTTPPSGEQPAEEPSRQEEHYGVSRLVSQSTSRPTSRLVDRPHSKIVDRPKAFYITERLNQMLDEAVRYYQDVHGIRKVDRSTIINAMLDHEANWSWESLDSLVDRIITQLASRLRS